tara:strand:- start:691 stop:840 length:150 start_codon:yes stop_codon:yes gene_type:complete
VSFDSDTAIEFDDPKTPKTIILNTVMGSEEEFSHVRHVPEGNTWHPADD